MSEGKQSRLSAAQRADVWRRWKTGESLHEIGRAYGKPHNCIRCVLLPRGGIAPAARERSRLALPLPAHCRRRLIEAAGYRADR